MKGSTFALALVIGLAVPALVLPAKADPGVADPGFCYVDMDNDGVYSAAAGDVNVETLILNDGQFDTQQDEGFYHAPCWPVSLVIPRSQALAQTSFNLRAGANLIVYGKLTAPSITLNACRTVDLTLSESTFVNQMTVNAGCNVILDGATITGDTTLASTLDVTACGNIYGSMVEDMGVPFVTAIATGSRASLCASGCIDLDGAALFVGQPSGTLSLTANDSVVADDSSFLDAPEGSVTARSHCSSVDLNSDFTQGNSLLVDANCSVSVSSTSIQTNNTTTIQAGGSIDDSSATINCGDLFVTSCYSSVNMNDTSIQSRGAIEVVGKWDVTANGVSGAVPPTVVWTAGTHILVKSTCGNVYARYTRMVVVAPLGAITFYAGGGGHIDVTGSVFIGTVTYGPWGVHVVGP